LIGAEVARVRVEAAELVAEHPQWQLRRGAERGTASIERRGRGAADAVVPRLGGLEAHRGDVRVVRHEVGREDEALGSRAPGQAVRCRPRVATEHEDVVHYLQRVQHQPGAVARGGRLGVHRDAVASTRAEGVLEQDRSGRARLAPMDVQRIPPCTSEWPQRRSWQRSQSVPESNRANLTGPQPCWRRPGQVRRATCRAGRAILALFRPRPCWCQWLLGTPERGQKPRARGPPTLA
jgi:hypothetical protein